MSQIEKKPFIITPFCILHYDDPTTNTYHGFINYPTRISDVNGNKILKCLQPPPEYENWKLYGTFYAFSPMIRPIPEGLKLINATKLGNKTLSTKEITYSYDPFNTHDNAVSFITWSQSVPSTVPLYLHISPDGISYPSFEKKPPSNAPGWTKNIMNQLYVLVDPKTHPYKVDANLHPLPTWKINDDGEPEFKFSGSDNRCIPDLNGVSIEKCFLLNDEDVLQQNPGFGPTPLLTRLQQYNQENTKSPSNINKFFKNIPPYVIVICTTFFILSLVSCIIIIGNT